MNTCIEGTQGTGTAPVLTLLPVQMCTQTMAEPLALLCCAATTATVNAHMKAGTPSPARTLLQLMNVHTAVLLLLLLAHAIEDRCCCYNLTKHCGWNHSLEYSDQWSRNNSIPPATLREHKTKPEARCQPPRIRACSPGVLS